MLSPARLEAYMHRTAALGRVVIQAPPFTLYLQARDPLRYFNYAKPISPVGGDLSAPLAELIEAFRAHKRMPRFEFLAEFAPELPASLEMAGFQLEGRNPLLVCTPETLVAPPAVAGLEIITLGRESPVEDLRAHAYVLSQAFADEGAPAEDDSDKELARRRESAERGGAFLARLYGVAVGGANFSTPLDDLSELTGIGVLSDYRHQGIASALTARAAATAFARGVEIAFLSAADERAGRVYERAGFRLFATALAYYLPA